MAIAMGQLGISPNVLWQMTLPELAAAIRGRFGLVTQDTPPGRADLFAMMQAYPDAAPNPEETH